MTTIDNQHTDERAPESVTAEDQAWFADGARRSSLPPARRSSLPPSRNSDFMGDPLVDAWLR